VAGIRCYLSLTPVVVTGPERYCLLLLTWRSRCEAYFVRSIATRGGPMADLERNKQVVVDYYQTAFSGDGLQLAQGLAGLRLVIAGAGGLGPPHWSPGCCPRAGRVLRPGGIAPGPVPASARRCR
jgi:hypothetical protein